DGQPSETIPVTNIAINGEKEIAIDTSTQLTIDYTPVNTTEKGVNWSSSDESVATVDENGIVKGIAEGKTTITATSKYNSALTVTHEIEVKTVVVKTIDEAREFNKGQYVTVQGIVTFKDSNNNYFIQDETAAIDIYKYGQDLGFEIGDEVQ